MKLATVRSERGETAALVTATGALPVRVLNEQHRTRWATDLLALIESGRFGEFCAWAAQLPPLDGSIPLDLVEYGPLYRRPRKIWGIGLNYAEHAGDLSETAPSEEPASFMKPDTAIIGPGERIRLPEQSKRVTGEAELGLVIGREAKDVDEQEAPSVVAGLTAVLDMTAEDILRRNPRYLTRAKSFDTFFSFGPHLVTSDELPEIGDLAVATVLNGVTRRKNVVANMTFSPWELVSFHSRVMTLLPGDIISTGTPGAVVLREGDVLACHIEGFEPLSNPVGR
jgi:2-keto-4-pentenoate hydratase/2-oxohepta-3-ene-1,7-dioic acid hydratase in catechol pathway